MKLHTIDAGHFKLDGGAMFSVVPKVLWERLIPADSNNHIPLAMRCLLIETEDRRILIDCGMGDKQDARWQGFYYRHGEGDLLGSLEKAGFGAEAITDVIPSHLHFDHCGGAVQWNQRRDGYELTFPNATYWAHREHWEWAMRPNPREKATFLTENLQPIQHSGHLQFLDEKKQTFGPFIEFLIMDGHTEKMLLPKIQLGQQTVVFTADLIPTAAHVPVNYLMSYDVRPLQTMLEKEAFLRQAVQENWILVSDHDATYEALTVQETEKGFRIKESGKLSEFI
ncbi:MBL fold metallo-hydrolase [Siphonobacter curvatus]|uniref:MBL fold metallo-hydrolase n=1 Tax=Siphonobacter curvatus TaxID=2094562 RepID=A0A2S7IKR1_9BACT|nr:MBL fold metallo-hydrolase [Siphonobacter curvatus]PQA58297.1 MBL fold metallo-hydrolase [Siphonobacter curvatus]